MKVLPDPGNKATAYQYVTLKNLILRQHILSLGCKLGLKQRIWNFQTL